MTDEPINPRELTGVEAAIWAECWQEALRKHGRSLDAWTFANCGVNVFREAEACRKAKEAEK